MDHLKRLLEEKGVNFEILQHEQPILRAQDGADFFGIEIGQTAPTFILESEKGFYAMITSGARGRVSFEDIAALVGCQSLKLAKPKEVERITGYTVGSVPLVGIALPCIFDRALLRYPFIYGGTGDSRSTLKIAPEELEKLNQIVCSFE
ncbi:aminoacyl-tRNA deacylase [Brevibacillus reuszeri]|uniref:aminoacyl-tRNA deacylase n=1 Tax=Brevibacillus reuszeri TaxID=54915 RepID=UPI00289C69EE|nr:YbaK/EbsC family protein [Brevibacillus reuszeri]